MRPHLAHINNMLIKKKLAEEAKESKTSYAKYSKLVEKARNEGHEDDEIIEELEREKERIINDYREGDPIFQSGLINAKAACLNSLELVISEITSGIRNVD